MPDQTKPPPPPLPPERKLLDPEIVQLTDNATLGGIPFYDWLRAYGALSRLFNRDAHLGEVIAKWPAAGRRRAARALLMPSEEPTPVPHAAPPLLPPAAQVESEHINRVIVAMRGDTAGAADVLGIARSTLYRKLAAMPDEWRSPMVRQLLEEKRRARGGEDGQE